MAFEIPLFDMAYTANADLSSLQFHVVKVTAAVTVGTTSATTDTPVGVLQNKPGSLEAAAVRILGVSKCVADAAVTAGSLIACSADAKGVMTAIGNTSAYTLGIAVDAASNADEVFSLLLTHAGRGA